MILSSLSSLELTKLDPNTSGLAEELQERLFNEIVEREKLDTAAGDFTMLSIDRDDIDQAYDKAINHLVEHHKKAYDDIAHLLKTGHASIEAIFEKSDQAYQDIENLIT